MMEHVDVMVIGGGQAGLAVGYHLRRTGLSFAILDAEDGPGGAWRRTWRSLRLFSPAAWSSLPGWLMGGGENSYPGRDDVLDYLAHYETRYDLPIHRPVTVRSVDHAEDGLLRIASDQGDRTARMVVSATGTWRRPYIPDGSSWIAGWWRFDHATRAATRAPSRALPRWRVLWTN